MVVTRTVLVDLIMMDHQVQQIRVNVGNVNEKRKLRITHIVGVIHSEENSMILEWIMRHKDLMCCIVLIMITNIIVWCVS